MSNLNTSYFNLFQLVVKANLFFIIHVLFQLYLNYWKLCLIVFGFSLGACNRPGNKRGRTTLLYLHDCGPEKQYITLQIVKFETGIVNLGSPRLTQVGGSHPWKITVKQRPRCYKENPGDPVTIETSPSGSGKVSARLNKPDLRASLPPQQEHSDWSQSRSNMLILLKRGGGKRKTVFLKHTVRRTVHPHERPTN